MHCSVCSLSPPTLPSALRLSWTFSAWMSGTPLQNKLRGSLGELQKVVTGPKPRAALAICLLDHRANLATLSNLLISMVGGREVPRRVKSTTYKRCG